jgi:hypothetical protein
MRGLKLYLIISAVIMVVYVVAQYYKPKPTDWTPTYVKEDKIPFGLYILYNEIGSLFPKTVVRSTQEPVYNTLKGINYQNSNYLLVAGSLDLDKEDYKELESYLRNGNDIFIATFELGQVLRGRLKIKTNVVYGITETNSVPINFVNPDLRRPKPYIFDKGLGDQYFSSFDSSKVTVLGKNQKGQANFIRYSYGKGNLYLLPNPQLLTNYNLIRPDGADYAAKALSYLDVRPTLLWDERYVKGNMDDASLFRVIFKNEKLRWAYYTALISLLIFVLFEIKRRQRIIPIIEPLKNSSVDFVKVVGSVYYEQRDNTDISHKKISYFLEFIRTNYRLKTQELDREFAETLIAKTGLESELIYSLIQLMDTIMRSKKVPDHQLISLNRSIEHFYKQVQ